MKLGQYVSGEAQILLQCDHPTEMRARLKLMHKLGYWAAKFDCPSARSIYAVILRGIETACETWNFDPWEYASDMLTANNNVKQNVGRREEQRRPRDVLGECNLDAPHMAKIREGGQERMVHHVCSSCLIKEGKKLYHPNGGQGCPRSEAS